MITPGGHKSISDLHPRHITAAEKSTQSEKLKYIDRSYVSDAFLTLV